jgi:hypothetical protein
MPIVSIWITWFHSVQAGRDSQGIVMGVTEKLDDVLRWRERTKLICPNPNCKNLEARFHPAPAPPLIRSLLLEGEKNTGSNFLKMAAAEIPAAVHKA